MDSVKTFFAGYSKDATTINNNQRQQNHGYHGNMSMSTGMGYANDTIMNGNGKTKSTNQCDAKSKDSDKFFYIMWR